MAAEHLRPKTDPYEAVFDTVWNPRDNSIVAITTRTAMTAQNRISTPPAPLAPRTSGAARYLSDALGGSPGSWCKWLDAQAGKGSAGIVSPIPGTVGWRQWSVLDLAAFVADELARREAIRTRATVAHSEPPAAQAQAFVTDTGRALVRLTTALRLTPHRARQLAAELLAEADRAEALVGSAA